MLEVYENLEAFCFEDAAPPGGRIGRLYRETEKAKDRAVTDKPLPKDFPCQA